MDLDLGGRKALVTGASKGIGRAAARALAAEGCDLVLVARSAGDLVAARDEIRAQHNVAVSVVPLDLSQGDAARSLARDFPDIDILVNNAGAIPRRTIEEIDGSFAPRRQPDAFETDVGSDVVVVRGRVEEWLEGDAAWEIIDQLSMKYIGAPYSRGQERVVVVIEPERQTVGVG